MTTHLDVEIETHEQEELDHATLAVVSDRGQHVTFEVRYRRVRHCPARYIVGIKGSDGAGFSAHLTFATAFRQALARATRYQRALTRAEKRRSAA